jgi:hypothetical protein
MMLITGKKGVDPTNAAAFVKGDPQFDALQKIADDAVKHAAAAKLPALNLLKAPADFTLANLIQTVKNGICVKLCITIARPFIEHHMLSAVAAVSGRDTGATLYGPADMCVHASSNSNRLLNPIHCIQLICFYFVLFKFSGRFRPTRRSRRSRGTLTFRTHSPAHSIT